mgnify:CR=1 FL=1
MKKTLIMILLIIISTVSNIEIALAETTLNCSNTLKSGAKGEQVKILQTELNEVMSCGLSIDGSFGPATKSCVIKFQAKYSLTQDGSVGPKTCPKINEVYKTILDNNEENLAITTTITLKKDSNSSQVKVLKKMLNTTTHCNLKTDSEFEEKTEWCVKKYQEEHNLDIDGKVGPMTRQSLNNIYLSEATNKESLIITEVTNNFLNVRADATTNSKDLGDVYTGEVYKIHDVKTNSNGTKWYKIEYQSGKFGYISGNYTEKDFIKLDISQQNLKLYKNGKEVLNVPVVTGNKAKGHDTPTGIYSIGYMNDYIKNGERIHLSKYDSYVDYWMSFIGGSYGFHDADWRSATQLTNKATYLTNGSHGCVNMFREDAKYLYENISSGLSVYIVK